MSAHLLPPPANRDWPIGIFDSGVGGLTVVRQIHQVLPAEDLIYLGDTARVPYGTKSPETVIRFAHEDVQFLVHHQVKAIVVACNTASAWAGPSLQRDFTQPIFGVIGPGAKSAVAKSRSGRIGVIGTKATIRSDAYTKRIVQLEPRAAVFAAACPLLVPLVEEGWLDRSVTRAVLEEYLTPLMAEAIDTLVLGCTHYPLLKPMIQQVVGSHVALIDSAEACAASVQDELQRMDLLCADPDRRGAIRPFVTDEPERFQEVAARFLGVPTAPAAKVDLC
ncbi:MAG: glutamate racemase [Verrucomicrobiota bacterium]